MDEKYSAPEIEKLIGSSWWTYLEMIYLIGKYQTSCVFLPLTVGPVSEEEYTFMAENPAENFLALSWLCKENSCSIQAPRLFSEEYKKAGFFRYSKYLRECIEKSERLSVIPLELISYETKKSEGHANILIYDKLYNTLERFDPHGNITPSIFRPELLDIKIEKFFSVITLGINTEKSLTYFPPESYCPVQGPQILEQLSRKKLGITLEKGFCSVWTFVYANYRLRFPDKKRETIIAFVNSHIQKENSEPYHFAEKIISILGILSEKIRNAENIQDIEKYILEAAKF